MAGVLNEKMTPFHVESNRRVCQTCSAAPEQDGWNSITSPACQLWQWCLQRGITLSAEHLPGSSNIIADQESRLLHSSAEWMLNRGIFSWIMEVLVLIQLVVESVCNSTQPPVESIFELEARPVCNGDRVLKRGMQPFWSF